MNVNRQCKSLHEQNIKRIPIGPSQSLNARNDWNHNREDVHGGHQGCNLKRGKPNISCITKDKVSQFNKKNDSLNNKDFECNDAKQKCLICHHEDSLEIRMKKKYEPEVQRGDLKSDCNFTEEKKDDDVLKAKKCESIYYDQNKLENVTKQQKRKQKTCDLQNFKYVSKEKMHKNLKNRDLQMKKITDDCQHRKVVEAACPTAALEDRTGTKQCFGRNFMLAKHEYDDLEKELEKSDVEKNVDSDGGKKCNFKEVKDLFFKIEEGKRRAEEKDLEKEKLMQKYIDEKITKNNKRKEKEVLQVKLDQSRFKDNAKKDMYHSRCTEQTNTKTFADPQNAEENEKSDHDELNKSELLEVIGGSDLTEDYEHETSIESEYSDSGPASGQEDSWPYLESDKSIQDNKILDGTREWLDEVDEKIRPEIRKKCISCSEDLDETKYQHDEKEKEESQNIIEKKVQDLEINNNMKNSDNVEEKDDNEKDNVDNKLGKDAGNIENIQSIDKKSDDCDNSDLIGNTEDAVRNQIFMDAGKKDEIDLKDNIGSMFSESNDSKVEREICYYKGQNEVNADKRLKEESVQQSRNEEISLKSNRHSKKYNGASQLPRGFHIDINKLRRKIMKIQCTVSDMELKMTELCSKISEMENHFRDGDMLAESFQIHTVQDVCQSSRRHVSLVCHYKQPKFYARRLSQPDLPDYLESYIWLPDRHDKGWNEIFTARNRFGRQCSNFGNENGGHMNGSGKSNNNYNKNNAEKDGSKENNNGWSEKYNSNNGENSGSAGGSSVEPPKNMIGIVAVKYDPKKYRKKHCDMDMHESEEWIGQLMHNIKRNEGPVLQVPGHNVVMKTCVLTCLKSPEELSDDMLNCFLCTLINSLLQHYASCAADFNGCDICLQIFSIICAHVHDCVNNDMLYTCEIRLCVKIKLAIAPNNILMEMRTLWLNVRKKLAKIIGRVDRAECKDKDYAKMPTQSSVSMQPILPSIPKLGLLTETGSRNGSQVLICNRSNLSDIPEAETVVSGPIVQVQPEVEMHESDAVPMSDILSGQGSARVHAFTGVESFQSPPQGPPECGEYSPSFKDTLTGVEGTDKVVYGNESQIINLSAIWENFKLQSEVDGQLAMHHKEEGVILIKFKKNMKIAHGRYNKDLQWYKLIHLGNGMSGKCYLASDVDTDFRFCVKELHISNLKKEEIELWCELDHPNIVMLYGAIRHGEKIFILQEFIAGGCLTEAINMQKKLGCRLSQITALDYFKQILEVLIYLKSRKILHEDLKADNILLSKVDGKVSIKVTDFGLARRCQSKVPKGTKPVGTQTQWSPEKAECVEYDFAAEVWAGVCVLVHILSGLPPWIRKFENLKALMLVIVNYSPPLDDVPRNIDDRIKDLIGYGFTVCQGQRPSAEDLLKHASFRLLEEKIVDNKYYSMLDSQSIKTNEIEGDPCKDLKEIVLALTAHEPNVKQVPPNTGDEIASGRDRAFIQHHSLKPSQAEQNIVPRAHIYNFIDDAMFISIPNVPLTLYQPYQSIVTEESENQIGINDEDMMKKLFPDFKALEISLSMTEKDINENDFHENSTEEEPDLFRDFEFDNAWKEVLRKFIPNVIAPTIELQSSSSTQSSESTSAQEAITIISATPRLIKSPIAPDDMHISIENDDELFKSESPQNELKIFDISARTVPSITTGTQTTSQQIIYQPQYDHSANTLHQHGSDIQTSKPQEALKTYQQLPVQNHQLPHQLSSNTWSQQPKGNQLIAKNLLGERFEINSARGMTKTVYQESRASIDSTPGGLMNTANMVPYQRAKQQMTPITKTAQANEIFTRLKYGTRPKIPLQNFQPSENVSPPQNGHINPTHPCLRFPITNSNFNEKVKTPIFSPFLNPRPMTPEVGTKTPDLHLGIKKAQSRKPAPCGQMSAPVTSPSKTATTQVNPAYQWTRSEILHVQSMPNMTIHSPNSKDSKMSRSTTKSQFKEQDEAFLELSCIPKDDLLQHSGSDNLMLSDHDMDDVINDQDIINGEIDLDIEDPASSLAHYLDHSINEWLDEVDEKIRPEIRKN